MNAPRLRTFTIIICISFVLHVLLLVQNALDYQSKARDIQGKLFLIQLTEASRVAINNNDRISLSVIIGQYTNNGNISKVRVTDSQKRILAEAGAAPHRFGKTYETIVTMGDEVKGSIAITMYRLNRGEVMRQQWPFLLCALFIHFIVWLLYPYIARPEKELLELYAINNQRDVFSSVPNAGGSSIDFDRAGTPFGGSGKTYEPSKNQSVHDITSIHTKHRYQLTLRIEFFDPLELTSSLSPSLQLAFMQLHQTLLEKAIAAVQTQLAERNVKHTIANGFDSIGISITLEGLTLDTIDFAALFALLYKNLSKAFCEHARHNKQFCLPVSIALAESTQSNIPVGVVTQAALQTLQGHQIGMHIQQTYIDHLHNNYILQAHPTAITTSGCNGVQLINATNALTLKQLEKMMLQILSDSM